MRCEKRVARRRWEINQLRAVDSWKNVFRVEKEGKANVILETIGPPELGEAKEEGPEAN